MKNFFFASIIILFLNSCDSKKQYEGQWTNYFFSDYGYNETKCIVIENDSIKFNYPYFDHWNKYRLTIENEKLIFNNFSFNAQIKKDTLSFNDSINFVRDNKDLLYTNKPILEINLPEIENIELGCVTQNNILNFIFFGKRLDNNQYGLQLNDDYGEINDLPAFLITERAASREELAPLFTTILIVDKKTEMKYIEDIFYQLKKINSLKVKLINSVDVGYDNKIGLHYEYLGLLKKLPNLMENDFYIPQASKPFGSPPPPPAPYPFFKNYNLDSEFVLLKNNNIYYNNQIISNIELERLVIKWVRNKNAIFSLYDLESTYDKFLEMTAIINSVYQNERNKLLEVKLGKSLEDLVPEEINTIKQEIPIKHVWSFSIPHYNSIVGENNSFFGIKVPYIDSASSAE